MNDAHLHLVLNHLPILGVLFGLIILTSGFFLKNKAVKQTALGMFALSAILAIPAYLTGEPAEELVESLPGVTENLIEAHEDLASIFLWIVGGLGLFSLVTFYTDYKSSRFAPTFYAITFVAAIGSMIFAQQVGASGGAIRHTEIRTGATAATQAPVGTQKEDDDD